MLGLYLCLCFLELFNTTGNHVKTSKDEYLGIKVMQRFNDIFTQIKPHILKALRLHLKLWKKGKCWDLFALVRVCPCITKAIPNASEEVAHICPVML